MAMAMRLAGHGGEFSEEQEGAEVARGAVVAGWEAGKEAASEQKAKKVISHSAELKHCC